MSDEVVREVDWKGQLALVEDLKVRWRGLPWPPSGYRVTCPTCFKDAIVAAPPPPGPLEDTPPFAFCPRDGIVWLEPPTSSGAQVTTRITKE
jgi:hypothetical protein